MAARGNADILTINAGSSSIKFGLYAGDAALRRHLSGTLDRIGVRGTQLVVRGVVGPPQVWRVTAASHGSATEALLDWLDARGHLAAIAAVGHRVVHGMSRSTPQLVTSRLLAVLRRITPFDPEHLPRQLALIHAFRRRRPRLPQVVCFDTAFHRTMPDVASVMPIPRRYAARGVKRYGFHGLSYASIVLQLQVLDPAATASRVIIAHLGNGASVAAVKDGKSLDTTMGFTPSGGIAMGTRAGDLDPSVGYYLWRSERMTAAQFQAMTTQESGLLGISGTSADMRDLLRREAVDTRAAEAVALFCYQVKKAIGAYAAALGGLDTLVFTGGIGEHAAVVRARICRGLGFLGITLDRARNAAHRPVISLAKSRVTVRVMTTDEEGMIARSVLRTVQVGPTRRHMV